MGERRCGSNGGAASLVCEAICNWPLARFYDALTVELGVAADRDAEIVAGGFEAGDANDGQRRVPGAKIIG